MLGTAATVESILLMLATRRQRVSVSAVDGWLPACSIPIYIRRMLTLIVCDTDRALVGHRG